jgi:hypothetical protein
LRRGRLVDGVLPKSASARIRPAAPRDSQRDRGHPVRVAIVIGWHELALDLPAGWASQHDGPALEMN